MGYRARIWPPPPMGGFGLALIGHAVSCRCWQLDSEAPPALSWAKASLQAQIFAFCCSSCHFSLFFLFQKHLFFCESCLQCCLLGSPAGAVCGLQHVSGVKVIIVSERSAERAAWGRLQDLLRELERGVPCHGPGTAGGRTLQPCLLALLLFHPCCFFFPHDRPVVLFTPFYLSGKGKRMVVVRQQQWSVLSLLPHLLQQLCPSPPSVTGRNEPWGYQMIWTHLLGWERAASSQSVFPDRILYRRATGSLARWEQDRCHVTGTGVDLSKHSPAGDAPASFPSPSLLCWASFAVRLWHGGRHPAVLFFFPLQTQPNLRKNPPVSFLVACYCTEGSSDFFFWTELYGPKAGGHRSWGACGDAVPLSQAGPCLPACLGSACPYIPADVWGCFALPCDCLKNTEVPVHGR